MADTITLFCLVHGDNPVDNAFPIEIHKNATIAELKDQIKVKKSNHFSNVDADMLILWKVAIPVGEYKTQDAKIGAEKLSAFGKIQVTFPKAPSESHVHILIERSSDIRSSQPMSLPVVLSKGVNRSPQERASSPVAVLSKDVNRSPQQWTPSPIAEITPPTTKSSQPKSTPLRQTLSSLFSQKETRLEVNPILNMELKNAMHRDVPAFIKTIFPTYNSTNIIKKIRQSDAYKDYPSIGDGDEKIFYNSFVKLATEICRMHGSKFKRQFINQADNPVGGGISKRRPDLVMVDCKLAETKINWKDVHVIGEVRKVEALDNKKTDIQLASYVREVFGAQPNRRAVLGFTLCGHNMRVWQFDRAGGIGSKAFNIRTQLDTFIRVIIGFYTMEPAALGYDPTIKTDQQDTSIFGYIKIGRETFALVRSVFVGRVIVGRGTICWEAYKKGDPTKRYAIKDAWQPTIRDSEGKILKEISDKLPQDSYITKYYHHQELDNINDIRHNLQPLDKQENRLHTRIIMSTFGRPIYKFQNRRELLQALRDGVEGHQQLCSLQILHRDISINNILIGEDGRGFIIDFDYAVYWSRNASQAKNRTGTGPFMAIEVLEGGEHKPQHDLESFLYVFLWICSEYTGPNGQMDNKTQRERLSMSWKGSFNHIAQVKTGMMIRQFKQVLSTFSPYFASLKKFARKFHEVFFPKVKLFNFAENVTHFAENVTHRDVLKVLDEALGNLLDDVSEDDVSGDDVSGDDVLGDLIVKKMDKLLYS